MDDNAFKTFLKKKGKKNHVVEKNIRIVKIFKDYLQKERNKKLDETTKKDIEQYVEKLERNEQSAKGTLYVLINYFKFTRNNELLKHTSSLRAERTKKSRRIFPIREFLDINPLYIKKLEEISIRNVQDMLNMGKTKKQREKLAKQLNVPEEAILELVKLSDLTRLGYVKAKLTRLFYNSGLDSPQKIAEFEPDELHSFFVKFVQETNWNGMVPNPSDLVNNIASARKLEKLVEE